MTVQINGYTVEIKAKGLFDEKFNKAATQATLNHISLLFSEAAEHYKHTGVFALEENARKDGTAIYEMLLKQGYYSN